MKNHQELKSAVCKVANQLLSQDSATHEPKNRAFKERFVYDLIDTQTMEYNGYEVVFYLNGHFHYSFDWLESLSEKFCTKSIYVCVDRARLTLRIRILHSDAEKIVVTE